ncbi:DUF4129 domain-containing protein [Thermosediminibacter litoriperuensis]|uniref:Uncharacterized protein DUF4129 n=1 Tax=Thermosediminibacter litoriperuensis TaxID=291989 RepID=A0A5S5AP86_9FIRM|nr:DUF4129 domain-containing protein [Thermosediminibacter litoriperuensis]TYP53281.1 uncharacterized protein DUF4129 [Thermosediminibacter litoriperuensis]
MKFPSSDWYRVLKIILFYGVNCLFALIVLSVFRQYAPEGVLLPAYEVLLWLLAGLLFNTAYYRFESLKKPLFISVLVLITVLKIGSGYYELVVAFFCFILGAGQGSWVPRHYELMAGIRQYTLLILLCLLFYKDQGKTGELLLLLTSYILISLIALSTYNMETLSSRISKKRWLLTTLIISLSAVLISLLFVEFVDPAYVSAFFSLLKGIYFALIDIVLKILTPLMAPIVSTLSFIISALLKRSRIRGFQAGSGEAGERGAPYEYEEYVMPEGLEIILKIAGFILVILVFATLILIVLKKYTPSDKKDFAEDEREPVFKPGSIKNSLLQLILKAGRVLNSYTRIAYGDSLTGKIRRIYVQILKEAAKRGYYRNSSETPLEYMPRLKKAFEDAGGFVERITLLYQRARYFPGSVSPSDVEEMKKLVKSLLSK